MPFTDVANYWHLKDDLFTAMTNGPQTQQLTIEN